MFLKEGLKKRKIKVENFPLKEYIFVPKTNEIDLIDKIKTIVLSLIFSSVLHTTFHANVQGPKKSWGLDLSE